MTEFYTNEIEVTVVQGEQPETEERLSPFTLPFTLLLIMGLVLLILYIVKELIYRKE